MVAGNRVSFSEGCNCSAKSDFLSRQVSEDIIQHLPLPLRPFTFLEFIPSRETLLFLFKVIIFRSPGKPCSDLTICVRRVNATC